MAEDERQVIPAGPRSYALTLPKAYVIANRITLGSKVHVDYDPFEPGELTVSKSRYPFIRTPFFRWTLLELMEYLKDRAEDYKQEVKELQGDPANQARADSAKEASENIAALLEHLKRETLANGRENIDGWLFEIHVDADRFFVLVKPDPKSPNPAKARKQQSRGRGHITSRNKAPRGQ